MLTGRHRSTWSRTSRRSLAQETWRPPHLSWWPREPSGTRRRPHWSPDRWPCTRPVRGRLRGARCGWGSWFRRRCCRGTASQCSWSSRRRRRGRSGRDWGRNPRRERRTLRCGRSRSRRRRSRRSGGCRTFCRRWRSSPCRSRPSRWSYWLVSLWLCGDEKRNQFGLSTKKGT